jgi:hypothetical protein
MCVFDMPATFLEVRAVAVLYSVGKWKKIKCDLPGKRIKNPPDWGTLSFSQ